MFTFVSYYVRPFLSWTITPEAKTAQAVHALLKLILILNRHMPVVINRQLSDLKG